MTESVIPDTIPEALIANRAACATCRRPVLHFKGEGWFHLDSALDRADSREYHQASPWWGE